MTRLSLRYRSLFRPFEGFCHGRPSHAHQRERYERLTRIERQQLRQFLFVCYDSFELNSPLLPSYRPRTMLSPS